MFELFGNRAENASQLEALLRSFAEMNKGAWQFHVSIPLELPLQATVMRGDDRQTVNLQSGSRRVALKRSSSDDPGDVSVSCSPDGDTVPITSINIDFRSIDDIYTDRGIVWVFPGSPAMAMFVLTRRVLDAPDIARDIADAAVRAMKEQVLRYFTEPVN